MKKSGLSLLLALIMMLTLLPFGAGAATLPSVDGDAAFAILKNSFSPDETTFCNGQYYHYQSDDDTLQVFYSYTYNGQIHTTYLFIPKDLSTPFYVRLIMKNTSEIIDFYSYVEESFCSSTEFAFHILQIQLSETVLSYPTYNALLNTSLRIMLDHIQEDFLAPAGYSIGDLGFTGYADEKGLSYGEPLPHIHQLTAYSKVNATCENPGIEAYWKCTDCGLLFSDAEGQNEIPTPVVIPALGHDVELKNAKAATCTEAGYTGDDVCKVCGKTVKQGESIPALGHSWSEWEVTKPATKEEDGAMQRVCSVCGAVETGVIPSLEPKPTVNPFIDVFEDQYYYAPVLWAVNHTPQITNGTGTNTFSPEATCTRDQIVTFLWRAMGCPEPTSTVNPFVDVQPSDYFYKPVLWAVEKGITNGMDASHFGPAVPCSRAHVVTFLWRVHEKPAAGTNNPFVDVPTGQYYSDAVLWAVSKDITNGMDATHFGPNEPCQRGQIVTFLYRDMA